MSRLIRPILESRGTRILISAHPPKAREGFFAIS